MRGRREVLENRNCKLESLEEQSIGAGGDIVITAAAAAATAVAGLHRHPVG